MEKEFNNWNKSDEASKLESEYMDKQYKIKDMIKRT